MPIATGSIHKLLMLFISQGARVFERILWRLHNRNSLHYVTSAKHLDKTISHNTLFPGNWKNGSRRLSRVCNECGLIVRALRDRTVRPVQLRQISTSSIDNGHGGDGKKRDDLKVVSSSSNNRDQEIYDPKKDNFFTQDIAFGSKENKGSGNAERPVFIPEEVEDSEEEELIAPTNCCGTGCPNCVWIEYAEKLTKRISNPKMGKERILRELEAMEDQNIKSYVMMELRIMKII